MQELEILVIRSQRLALLLHRRFSILPCFCGGNEGKGLKAALSPCQEHVLLASRPPGQDQAQCSTGNTSDFSACATPAHRPTTAHALQIRTVNQTRFVRFAAHLCAPCLNPNRLPDCKKEIRDCMQAGIPRWHSSTSRFLKQQKSTAISHPSLFIPYLTRDTQQQKCVSRESNAGPIDGNDGFYH